MTNSDLITTYHRNRRRRRIRIVIFTLLGLAACFGIPLLALVIWATSWGEGGFGFDSACNISSPRAVESIGEFKLPPSSKLLYASCGGMQGMWAEAHFSMKPDELNVFLATTNIKSPLSNTLRPSKLICDCGANKVADYLYGGSKKSEWEEEVFIDTHDKNLYMVYFTVLGG